MDWLWWGVCIIVGYLVLAPVITVAALWAMLKAGVVPWSKDGPGLPSDPLTIGYRGDPKVAFGWEVEAVAYPTELGEAAAWVVPGAAGEKLWAIWVHGIGGLRENGYRMVKPLHDAGLPGAADHLSQRCARAASGRRVLQLRAQRVAGPAGGGRLCREPRGGAGGDHR